MGTDIHARVQYRHTGTYHDCLTKTDTPFEHWRTIHPPSWWPRDEWETKYIAELESAYQSNPTADILSSLKYHRAEWIAGRSYNLFAILADVRNGYGFAGVETGTEWPSIAPDRGLPDGIEVDDDEYPWLGDHSHTWLTVTELLAFDWHGTKQTHYGTVALDAYTPGKRPTVWSGGVWGGNILTVDESQVDGLAVPEGMAVYVRQSWEWTAAEACGWFVDEYLPAFQRLCTELGKSPDDVRLVIGFDS